MESSVVDDKIPVSTEMADVTNDAAAARVAATNLRLITLTQIRERFGLNESRFTIDRWIKAGRFPKPRRIAGGHHRYWFEHEFLEWLASMPEAKPLRRGLKKPGA